MLFVNFKTYQEATGSKALGLAQICREVGGQANLQITLTVQTADIYRLAQAGIENVWAQHVDDIEYGPHTGQVLPEAVLSAGAKGTVLNHSENRVPVEMIGTTVRRCQDLGLKTLVFAGSIEEGQELIEIKPDFLAYEPPELIGSRQLSVATAKPETIADFVKIFAQVPVIVGAGIHSFQDVKISLKLGARGILVATDVVLAKDPEKELEELAGGFE